MMPALLMSTSMGPSSRSTSSRNAVNPVWSVTSSGRASVSPPSSFAVRLARSLVQITDRNPRTDTDERGSGGCADPACAAGDCYDLAGQLSSQRHGREYRSLRTLRTMEN